MIGPAVPGPEGSALPDWRETFRRLTESADRPDPEPDPGTSEQLAVAAHMIGEDTRAVAAWEAAYREHLDRGADGEAALCGFWLALTLMLRGQAAHAGGWMHRAQEAAGDLDCPAQGYLLVPALLRAIDADDGTRARDLAVEARQVAERFGDAQLRAMATLGEGQALLALGDHAAGTARLDEVMLSVTNGEVAPLMAGIVYCAVLLECMQAYDLARATEWTEALDAWCGAQPDLVPYRGQCLVHRSQLLTVAGRWPAAVEVVEEACARLDDPPHPALGLARYQEGELRRLAGDLAGADVAYGEASRVGYEPMPGMALLDLARGQVATAAAGIRRALAEASQPFQRPSLLAAAVEIMVAADDLPAADTFAGELAAIAGSSTSEMLGALAEHATGAAQLGRGEPAGALVHLRAAGATWQTLRVPYEAARTSALVGRCCLLLGDRSAATLAFGHAREAFDSLGARVDLGRLDSLEIGPEGGEGVVTGGSDAKGAPAGHKDGDVSLEGVSTGAGTDPAGRSLSVRELEVLARVAEGRTNREVAAELHISPHTVGRHLENIFAKLGVTSRAGAAAYAYRHDLL